MPVEEGTTDYNGKAGEHNETAKSGTYFKKYPPPPFLLHIHGFLLLRVAEIGYAANGYECV